jgi:transitional endoplasmic reticulum ATPase
LSQLANKLGIVMVAHPLAAGELTRPLVGETEEILVALCSRCNHVPYAQCCISIDEIDSLAPKRDQKSSEGKVDTISVLLSMIEGIKDVHNLMIFSATNRLHMMDEAFLRRLSGKFFVGRPSSDARKTLLQQIPFWMVEPELFHRLSIATTNFSGSAIK